MLSPSFGKRIAAFFLKANQLLGWFFTNPFTQHWPNPMTRYERFFFPKTVGKFIQKHGDLDSDELLRMPEVDTRLRLDTRVNTLAGTPRKLITLFCAMSLNQNFFFDTIGADRQGVLQILEAVQEYVKRENKGAIFLTSTDFCAPSVVRLCDVFCLLNKTQTKLANERKRK